MQYNLYSVTLLSKWTRFTSHPAPWTTIHFPFIFFTSFAAASIASWLIVSKVFLCVTADPPSLMITSKSTLQAMFRPNAESKLTRRSRHPVTGSRPLIDRSHCHEIKWSYRKKIKTETLLQVLGLRVFPNRKYSPKCFAESYAILMYHSWCTNMWDEK